MSRVLANRAIRALCRLKQWSVLECYQHRLWRYRNSVNLNTKYMEWHGDTVGVTATLIFWTLLALLVMVWPKYRIHSSIHKMILPITHACPFIRPTESNNQWIIPSPARITRVVICQDNEDWNYNKYHNRKLQPIAWVSGKKYQKKWSLFIFFRWLTSILITNETPWAVFCCVWC